MSKEDNMAKNAYINSVIQPTPQSKPLPGRELEMAKNDAGGFGFILDDWKILERFLILGAEGGHYYVREPDLIMRNVGVLDRCIAADASRTAEIIAQVSESGRAFKNNVAAFALAYMVKMGGAPRFAAYREMNRVLRTGRSLLEFHQNLDKLGVTSTMSRRKAFGRWMTSRRASDLAYQAIKYQSSGTLGFKDVVRYAHASSDDSQTNNVLSYLSGNGKHTMEGIPDIIHGWEAIKAATTAKEVAALIKQYRLTWEFVPGQWQGKAEVWEALLPNLPYTALIRNLARISSYGLLGVGSDNSKYARDRLTDVENLRKARVHPMSLLVAWRTYASGGSLGNTKLTWTPNSVVRDALEEAFYLAFDAIEPSGKSMLIGVDVSGSMRTQAGTLPISCSEAAAVMAMATLRVEKDSYVLGFDHGIRDLGVSKHDSLETTLKRISNINAGGTDCALPMMFALDNGMQIDQFTVLTDNETWYGNIHPTKALEKYRQMTGIAAKLVVVAMLSSGFSIADPKDAGMLDVCGLDTSTPALISRFAVGL